MNLQKLADKGEKTINFTYGEESGYFTVKVYPLKSRKAIIDARTKGLNMELIRKYMLIRGIEEFTPQIMQDIIKDNPSDIFTKDFDSNYTDYKKLSIMYGMTDKHSLYKENGVILDIRNENDVEWLLDNCSDLADAILSEIDKWQGENSLKKSKVTLTTL